MHMLTDRLQALLQGGLQESIARNTCKVSFTKAQAVSRLQAIVAIDRG